MHVNEYAIGSWCCERGRTGRLYVRRRRERVLEEGASKLEREQRTRKTMKQKSSEASDTTTASTNYKLAASIKSKVSEEHERKVGKR